MATDTTTLDVQTFAQLIGNGWEVVADHSDADVIASVVRYGEEDPTVTHLWGKVPIEYYYTVLASTGWDNSWVLRNTEYDGVMIVQPPAAKVDTWRGLRYALKGVSVNRWFRLMMHGTAVNSAIKQVINRTTNRMYIAMVGFPKSIRYHEEGTFAAALQNIANQYDINAYRFETQQDTLTFCSENGWRIADSYRLYGMAEPIMVLELNPDHTTTV